MSRWIPVTESLPDADLTVLVATDPALHGEPVWLGHFDGECWREISGEPAFVTHWQDLPEPPAADPVLSDDLCDAYGVPRGSRRSEVQDDGPGPECTGRMRWVELGAAPFALTETSAACVRPADGVRVPDGGARKMTKTIGRIERTGTIHFHDASLAIWEEGIPREWNAAREWERIFKRQVFHRIVQTLNRIGWTLTVGTHIYTGENARYCRKGDLQADLIQNGRHIELKFFQNVVAPERPDHGGRYQFNQVRHMPYLLRLEMERSRRRIREYLCNVFTGYSFTPPKIASPNPDPLAYFNAGWDGEYEKRRGTHRFKRGADGWPSHEELGSWDRRDKDGALLNHGDVRWMRDRYTGHLLRGRVYGGINGMWMFVYGPGQRDHTHENAGRFFTFQAGSNPRRMVDAGTRRKRLEQEMERAVKARKFERAAVLRDVLELAEVAA